MLLFVVRDLKPPIDLNKLTSRPVVIASNTPSEMIGSLIQCIPEYATHIVRSKYSTIDVQNPSGGSSVPSETLYLMKWNRITIQQWHHTRSTMSGSSSSCRVLVLEVVTRISSSLFAIRLGTSINCCAPHRCSLVRSVNHNDGITHAGPGNASKAIRATAWLW